MTATVAANALGLVFWAAAAHLEPPAMVGRASAAVAALTLLAMIAQLNLTNVFIRLLPVAGRLGPGLVRRGYLAVVCLSVAAAVVYCASGLGSHLLAGGWGARTLFVLGVPVLAVFALEDSVLTALRLSPWVPVENISTAAGRSCCFPCWRCRGWAPSRPGSCRPPRPRSWSTRCCSAGAARACGRARRAARAPAPAVLHGRGVHRQHLRHRHHPGGPAAGPLETRPRPGRLPDAAVADRDGHQPGDVERGLVVRGRGRGCAGASRPAAAAQPAAVGGDRGRRGRDVRGGRSPAARAGRCHATRRTAPRCCGWWA